MADTSSSNHAASGTPGTPGAPGGGPGSSSGHLRLAWASVAFRHYFWASAFSTAGRALHTTIIGYIVYDLSGSDFLLGLVSFMQMVPQLLLAPIVGVAVDRLDRRKVLAAESAAQVIALSLLGLLALVGHLSVPAIAAVVVVMGIANAFNYPARSSLMPMLVPLHTLQGANSINSLMSNAGRIVIPTAIGALVDVSGVATVLLLGAGLYIPAAVIVVSIPLAAATVATTAAFSRGALEPAARSSVRTDLGDAISYIRQNAMLRAALINDVMPYLFGMTYAALLPAIASDTLNGGARMLGLLFGLAGVGALIGTLVAGALSGRGRRGQTIWVSTIGTGIGIVLIAAGSSLLVVGAGLVVTGVFQMLYIIQNDTLVQTFADDRFRGRAVAAQSMVNGLMPLGVLLLGIIAEFTTTSTALAFAGLMMIGSGVYTALFRPSMRTLR